MLASEWAAVKEKYDHNFKVLPQDCAMHMANANWPMDAGSSGTDWLKFKADAASSWLGCTGGDKLCATCVDLKTLLKSHRDVYDTFDEQLPQDLIRAATETRISAEALVHCVNVMKNLEKSVPTTRHT